MDDGSTELQTVLLNILTSKKIDSHTTADCVSIYMYLFKERERERFYLLMHCMEFITRFLTNMQTFNS